MKPRALQTISSMIRAEAASTCSPLRAFSKCSKTGITLTTTGSRITRRRSTPKLAYSFPNGEDFLLLRKDKVSKAPRSACMRRIEAQIAVPTSRVYAVIVWQVACQGSALVGVLFIPKVMASLPLRSIGDHKGLIFRLSGVAIVGASESNCIRVNPLFLKIRIVTTATFGISSTRPPIRESSARSALIHHEPLRLHEISSAAHHSCAYAHWLKHCNSNIAKSSRKAEIRIGL